VFAPGENPVDHEAQVRRLMHDVGGGVPVPCPALSQRGFGAATT
jgi:hypothetical protein